MKLSGAGWRRWKNDHRGTCKVSHVRVKRCPRSSDFPKRSILSRPRDPSLCCKPRLKAVVCQFRKRYRKFESTSLHHSVLHFSYLSENCSQSARVRAICDDGWTRRASPAAPIGRIGRILSGRDFGRSIGKAAGIGRFAPPGWYAAVLTIFSQGCGKSLPSWRRQSNECSRRQGYQALAREGVLT
jgi:hypothetical protein